MNRRQLAVSIALVAAFVLGAWSPAGAATATEQLRPAMDEILRLVNDPALKAPAMRQMRRAAIRRVARTCPSTTACTSSGRAGSSTT
jgi:hypothetical protein